MHNRLSCDSIFSFEKNLTCPMEVFRRPRVDEIAAADAAADAASAAEAKAEAADVLHEAAVLKEIKVTKSLARCWQPEDFTWPQYLVGFDVVKAPGNSALSEAAAKQRRVQFEKWARAVGKQKDAQHASRLAVG